LLVNNFGKFDKALLDVGELGGFHAHPDQYEDNNRQGGDDNDGISKDEYRENKLNTHTQDDTTNSTNVQQEPLGAFFRENRCSITCKNKKAPGRGFGEG
jgi:hypothetical protein